MLCYLWQVQAVLCKLVPMPLGRLNHHMAYFCPQGSQLTTWKIQFLYFRGSLSWGGSCRWGLWHVVFVENKGDHFSYMLPSAGGQQRRDTVLTPTLQRIAEKVSSGVSHYLRVLVCVFCVPLHQIVVWQVVCSFIVLSTKSTGLVCGSWDEGATRFLQRVSAIRTVAVGAVWRWGWWQHVGRMWQGICYKWVFAWRPTLLVTAVVCFAELNPVAIVELERHSQEHK